MNAEVKTTLVFSSCIPDAGKSANEVTMDCLCRNSVMSNPQQDVLAVVEHLEFSDGIAWTEKWKNDKEKNPQKLLPV